MRFLSFGLTVISCLIFAVTVSANQPSRELLESAEQAYKKGEFAEAQKAFSVLLTNPDIAKASKAMLYYNLANAEFKMGNKGSAYAWLLRAEKISPLDEEIAQNLHFVKSQLSPQATEVQPGGFYLSFIPEFLKVYRMVFLGLSLLLLTTQLFFYWRGRSTLISAVACYSGFALSLIIFLILTIERSALLAVVTQKQVVLRSGPNQTFSELSTLQEGAHVRISDRSENWYKVSFTQGFDRSRELIGWIEQNSVLTLDN